MIETKLKQIKASLKKGNATRGGFVDQTGVKDGEIEMTAQGANVVVDGEIEVEVDIE